MECLNKFKCQVCGKEGKVSKKQFFYDTKVMPGIETLMCQECLDKNGVCMISYKKKMKKKCKCCRPNYKMISYIIGILISMIILFSTCNYIYMKVMSHINQVNGAF